MTLNFIGRHQGPVVSPHWQLGWTGWSNFSILSRTAGDRRRISQTDGDLPFTRTSWRSNMAKKLGELAMFLKLTNWRSTPFSNDALHWKSHEIAIWDSFPYPFQWSSGLGSLILHSNSWLRNAVEPDLAVRTWIFFGKRVNTESALKFNQLTPQVPMT